MLRGVCSFVCVSNGGCDGCVVVVVACFFGEVGAIVGTALRRLSGKRR